VICETIVHDEEDWADWQAALDRTPALWVRLSAPLGVLEARESAEPTRIFHGLAKGMIARPAVGAYDLDADTGSEGVDRIVGRIIEALDPTPPPP
jgi:hypothetical protein